MTNSPPLRIHAPTERRRLGWHQDTGRLNKELETNPRPRISLKVAFFLTDTTELGRGNYVVPGSQLWNERPLPDDGVADPPGATAIRVPAGTAVFFDQRLWHAASPNGSDVWRNVLYYGYSYCWLWPRDNMTLGHCLEGSDLIRRQRLGAATRGYGYSSPTDDDVLLKAWIREHLGEQAVVA